MTVTIDLSGADAFRAALAKMSDEVQAQVSKAVVGTALELRTDVVKRVQMGPATGRVYVKKNPSRTHQASAPGQAPATDTGRLVNSITFDTDGPLTATVGSALAYAVHLEYGTFKMAARPFFRPAVEDIRAKFEKRLEKALGEALR